MTTIISRHIPRWPDFVVERHLGEMRLWVASTNTGRPRTPILNVVIMDRGHTLAQARAELRDLLWLNYRGAHPHGCPGATPETLAEWEKAAPR